MRPAIFFGVCLSFGLVVAGNTGLAEQIIRADERVPMGLLLIAATKRAAKTSAAEIVGALSRVIESQTRLRVETKDEAMFRECKGQISCLARVNGSAQLLLVISDVTRANQSDRFSATLIDAGEALRLYGAASREGPDWEAKIEARIEESCLLAGPSWIEIADVSRAGVSLEAFVIEELRNVFEAQGHWNAHAELALATNVAGARVELDGLELGVMSSTSARITGLEARPGRKISVAHPEYVARAEPVHLEPGKVARVELVLVRQPLDDRAASSIRDVVFWSGVASALAGGTLVAVAIARDENAALYCIGEDAAACPSGQMFSSSTNDPDRAPFMVREPGVSIASLGLALIAAGASWAVGTWLLGADDEVPWIQIVAGAVIGSLVFGISHTMDTSYP